MAVRIVFLLLLFILDATHLNISATLTFVPILITALGCGDIINSLSEVSMPFRAKVIVAEIFRCVASRIKSNSN